MKQEDELSGARDGKELLFVASGGGDGVCRFRIVSIAVDEAGETPRRFRTKALVLVMAYRHLIITSMDESSEHKDRIVETGIEGADQAEVVTLFDKTLKWARTNWPMESRFARSTFSPELMWQDGILDFADERMLRPSGLLFQEKDRECEFMIVDYSPVGRSSKYVRVGDGVAIQARHAADLSRPYVEGQTILKT